MGLPCLCLHAMAAFLSLVHVFSLFSRGNVGRRALQTFQRQHECSEYCRMAGLNGTDYTVGATTPQTQENGVERGIYRKFVQHVPGMSRGQSDRPSEENSSPDVNLERTSRVTCNDSETVTLGEPLHTHRLSRDVAGIGLISGLELAGNWLYVTWWHQSHLYIYNISADIHELYTFPDLEVVGMSLLNDTQYTATLVVIDKCHKIHFITVEKQTMTPATQRVTDINFDPCCISVEAMTRKLVMANSAGDTIAICDDRGKVEGTTEIKSKMRSPTAVLSTGDDEYVVRSTRSNNVHWVDGEGNVTHTYYGKVDKLINRCHMVSDGRGSLLVWDNNKDRVHVIGANRRLSHYVSCEKVGSSGPRSLCVDEASSRLVVLYDDCSYDYEARVYKWPP